MIEETEELNQLLERAEARATDGARWKQEVDRLQVEHAAVAERHAAEVSAMEATLCQQQAQIAGNIAHAMQAVQEAQAESGLEVKQLREENQRLEVA